MLDDLSAIPVCDIPAGTYQIGHGTQQFAQPLHDVELGAFSIAQVAVTNEQFKLFIEAGGYHNEAYWTVMGWRWLQGKGDIQPAFWDNPNFNHALQPIVGIGWYEAMAFVNWLSEVTGKAWRLPTEVEWEVASFPSDDNAYLNTTEKGIGRTLSVIGTDNLSWCGAVHMLGNVWEWTATRWGRNWQSLDYPYPYEADDGREDLSGSYARVMRGGSWFDRMEDATPHHRARFLPGSRASNIGFRLAVSGA